MLCTACLAPPPTSTLRSPLARPRPHIKAARTTTRTAQHLRTHMDDRNPATSHSRSSHTLSSTSDQLHRSRTLRPTHTSNHSNRHNHTPTWPPIAGAQHPSNNHPTHPTNNLRHRNCNARYQTNTHHSPPQTTRPKPKRHPPTSPTPKAQTTTTTTARQHPSSAHTATPHNRPSLHHRRCITAHRRSSSKRLSLRPHSPQRRGRIPHTRGRTRRRSISRLHSSINLSKRRRNSNGSSPSRLLNRLRLSSSSSRVTGTPRHRTRWAGMGLRVFRLRRKVSHRRRRWMSR